MQLLEAVTSAQYQRRIAQIQRDVIRLDDRAVRGLFGFLADLRARTLADLAMVPQDGGWPAHRLNTLLTEIDEAKIALQQRLAATLRDTTRAAWQIGSTAQSDALRLDIDTHPTALSLDQLMVAQALHADLVRRVSDDFRSRAAREILLTVAGAQTPYQAMTKIGGLLKTQGRGGIGTIAQQAERLVRTETMTVFNTADRIVDERLGQDVPGLRKWWDAASDPRTRPSHRTAENRYRPGGSEGPIPLNADFMVGGEKAQGPHDPRLSAAERVNCRCVRMVWSPAWGVPFREHLPGKHNQKDHGRRHGGLSIPDTSPSSGDAPPASVGWGDFFATPPKPSRQDRAKQAAAKRQQDRPDEAVYQKLQGADGFRSLQSDAGHTLSYEEDEAVRSFVHTVNYRFVNGYLRDGALPDVPGVGKPPIADIQGVVPKLDAVLASRQLPNGVRLYRSTIDADVARTARTDPESLIGRRFRDPGYISTTTDRAFADRFLQSSVQMRGLEQRRSERAIGADTVAFEVRAKQGTRALVTHNVEEREVLFPRDTTFRVRRVIQQPSGSVPSVRIVVEPDDE